MKQRQIVVYFILLTHGARACRGVGAHRAASSRSLGMPRMHPGDGTRAKLLDGEGVEWLGDA